MNTRPSKKERQDRAKTVIINLIANGVTDLFHGHYCFQDSKHAYALITDKLANIIQSEINNSLFSIDFTDAQNDIIESLFNEYQKNKKLPKACEDLIGNIIIKSNYSFQSNIKYFTSGLCRLYGLDLPLENITKEKSNDHLLHSTSKRIQKLQSAFFIMLAKHAEYYLLSQLKMESTDSNVPSTSLLQTHYSIFSGKQLKDTKPFKAYVNELDTLIEEHNKATNNHATKKLEF